MIVRIWFSSHPFKEALYRNSQLLQLCIISSFSCCFCFIVVFLVRKTPESSGIFVIFIFSFLILTIVPRISFGAIFKFGSKGNSSKNVYRDVFPHSGSEELNRDTLVPLDHINALLGIAGSPLHRKGTDDLPTDVLCSNPIKSELIGLQIHFINTSSSGRYWTTLTVFFQRK